MNPLSHFLSLISSFSNDWVSFIAFLGSISILIALSEFAVSKLNWKPETARKLVHMLVGFMTLLTPFIFSSNLPPIMLASIFIAFNLVTLRSGKLRGIHLKDHKTYGTVYFPVAYLLLCLFWWDRPVVFDISLSLLAVGDTLAAAVGKHLRSPRTFVLWEEKKTFQGSLVMFASSVLLVGMGTLILHDVLDLPSPQIRSIFQVSLLVGMMATIAEAVSKRGSDNLSIPLISAASYEMFMAASQNGELLIVFFWILISLALGLVALGLNTLSTSGMAGAFVIGVMVFGMGQWLFMIPMVGFFLSSSLLSKTGKRRKEFHRRSFGKGSKRDVVQVFANGGIPLILTVWWFYAPSDRLFAAYLASVAAATADTWATEIGLFSRRPPRHIISLRQMKPGTSGGVTLLGILSGLAGSTVISLFGLIFLHEISVFIAVGTAGFVASLIDSVLGATAQATYRCNACQRETELSTHCDIPALLVKGSRYINNDGVNLLCTLSGGGLILLLG
ncbi:MAG: DUF92 domain-containing protein [Candidatus Neomarinimicrobiota bacterium]